MNSKQAVVDIIEITDFHGEIEAPNAYPVSSALYNSIKRITSQNPGGSLVVGGGDLFDMPPLSRALNGIPSIRIMERLGLEVTAVGNHEFYWTMDIINNITMKGSSVSFLCANMFDVSTGELAYEPYRIFERNGVKVAVIGACGPINIKTVEIWCPEKYYTTDPVTELNKYAAQVRDEQKADIVIALVHEMGRIDNEGVLFGGLIELAQELKGFDAIYGGHSHSTLVASVNGIQVLNGGDHGRGFIHTRVTIEEGAQPELVSEYISIGDIEGDPEIVELDEEIEKIVEQAKIDTDYVYSEVVGYTDRPITKEQFSKPFGSSEIGNWLCDVLRERTGADAAIHSNNRVNNIIKGKITKTALFYASKKSTVCTSYVNKQELVKILEDAFRDEDLDSNIPKGIGIQVSGLRILYDMNKPSMNRIVDITGEDGTPLDENRKLLVAFNGRLVGGPKSPEFMALIDPENDFADTKIPVYEFLAANLKENSGNVKTVSDNRVVNVNA